MSRAFAALLAALAVTVASVPAWAGQTTLGIGVITHSFSGDLRQGKYFELSNRMGLALDLGYRWSPGWSLDLRAGSVKMKEDLSGEDADYLQLELGPTMHFNTSSQIQPFFQIGAGSYRLTIADTEYEGAGGFLSVGLEEFAGERHSLKVMAKGSYWRGDPYSLDAAALTFGLSYVYHFGSMANASRPPVVQFQ